jgi:hypothetical protein
MRAKYHLAVSVFDTDGNCAFHFRKKVPFDFQHFLPKIALVEYNYAL